MDQQAINVAKAIRQHESGNNFNAVGDNGTSKGAFQFQAATWAAFAKQILGDSNAPMTEANQNAVAYGMIKTWKDSGLNVAQIAAKWNSGSEKGWETKIGTKTYGDGKKIAYNVPKYVKSVTDIYQTLKTQNITPTPINTPTEKPGFFKSILNAFSSSEQAFGADIAGALSNILPKSWTGVDSLEQATAARQQGIDIALAGLKDAQQKGTDTTKWLKIVSDATNQPVTTIADLYPAIKKTNLQVVGDAAGTLLDILAFGSYGSAIKGAEAGKLLTTSKISTGIGELLGKVGIQSTPKIVTPVIENAVKLTFGQTLKGIAEQTAKQAAIGGGLGYGFDVSKNLQEGKTGLEAITPGAGAILGTILPVSVGVIRIGGTAIKEVTPKIAPALINSLVKPKAAAFAYGSDPGRTVTEMGIIGNSMDDFAKNIGIAKNKVGEEIGMIYSNSKNIGLKIDISSEINKIDKAMLEAAQKGKAGQSIVDTLKNAKDVILYAHGLDEKTGQIINLGDDLGMDITKLSPNEAFSYKQFVASLTRFTGSPSDDKEVNKVLQQVYGGIKDKLNTAVKINNPEILKLNRQYGDLVTAQIATINRDAILKRSNLISLPSKLAGAAGLVAGVISGGSVGGLLAAASSVALESALTTAAVRTRIAAWLGGTSPSIINKVIEKNPAIGKVLLAEFPESFKITFTRVFTKVVAENQ